MMVRKLIKRLSYTFVACAATYGAWYVWMGFPVAGYNFCTRGWKVMDESDRFMQAKPILSSIFKVGQQKAPRLNEIRFNQALELLELCSKTPEAADCRSYQFKKDGKHEVRSVTLFADNTEYIAYWGLQPYLYIFSVFEGQRGFGGYGEQMYANGKPDWNNPLNIRAHNHFSAPGCNFNGVVGD